MQVEVSGGIRDDRSLEAALESGATRINLGTAALENPEWAADVIGRYGDVIAVGLDVRGTTLAARGWTQEGGDLWTVLERLEDGRLQPLRRHRRHQGRHPAGPEPRAAPRDHLAHDQAGHRLGRSLEPGRHRGPARSRAARASRARSSARPCTRGRSRSPRRWMSPDTDPHDRRHRPAPRRLGRRAVGGPPLRVQPALRRRRLGRPGAAGRARRVPGTARATRSPSSRRTAPPAC